MASVRRRSPASPLAPKTPRPDLLNRDELMDLFHNCIKLASESKINQKKAWELGLIDHLGEIIQEEDGQTNFQIAGCILKAASTIYSLRVDSVHSEGYKVLGRINRAAKPDLGEDCDARVEDITEKDEDKRISPAPTLESSFEALNMKKFDVSFTVDPLCRQATARFDQGGAKGLLLYNLGVYGSCRVLFDLFEASDKCILSDIQEKTELIDLSFAKEQIEQMILHMPLCNDISPTLRDIVAQFDEENARPSYDASSGQRTAMEDQMVDNENDGSMQPDCEYDENDNSMNFNSTSYQEQGTDEYTFQGPDGPDVDERFKIIADFLSLGIRFSSKTNAWAGPDHWKYRKVKDLEPARTSSGDSNVTKKTKNTRGKEEPDIDFTKALKHEMANVLAPPKNPKSLLLPANKGRCNNKLPEDCHYQRESLVKLFLLPDVLCMAQRRKPPELMSSGPWDDDNLCNGPVDEGNAGTDTEEQANLTAKPRQVNKMAIQYDKVSEQVDVHALKEVLWNHIRRSAGTDDLVCLTKVLRDLRVSCSNPATPHLYFICLLHLANEHSLKLRGRPTLDEIDIYNIPTCAPVLCS